MPTGSQLYISSSSQFSQTYLNFKSITVSSTVSQVHLIYLNSISVLSQTYLWYLTFLCLV